MASLSLYQNFAITALTKAWPWQSVEAVDIDIDIAGGVHTGSIITLSKRKFIIGPSESGDVMLMDTSAAGAPVTIVAERSLLGPMISIETSRNDVEIDGRALKEGGKEQTFQLPCTLTLGNIPLRLTPHRQAAATGKRPAADILQIGALSCFCALAFTFATVPGQSSQSSFDITAGGLVGQRTAPGNTAGSMTSRVAASLVDATLRDYDLGDYLSASPKSAEAITIQGALPDTMRANWHAAREQFNTIKREMLVLSEFDIVPAHPTIPAIASVRFGNNPALIFADKSHASVGDVVTDGWRLDRVDEAGFTIGKFGVSLDIKY